MIIFLGSGNARLNLLFVFPYQLINAGVFFKPSALPHKPGLFLDVYAWLSPSGLSLTTVSACQMCFFSFKCLNQMFGYWIFLKIFEGIEVMLFFILPMGY